jgi:tetratricopeptide (TPR) repeat protein
MARSVDPSATGFSPSTDGDVTPPRIVDKASRKPFRLSLPSLASVAQTLEVLRRIAISLSLFVLLAIGVTFLVREVIRERVIIEPVVVLVDEPKGGWTSEAIGHEVSRHFAVIQRIGAAEWGFFYVDAEPRDVEEVGSIITRPINLKEFGAPLSVTTSLAEIANMLGVKHPTIKISISSRRAQPGYTSSVSKVGDVSARASCDSDNTPQGIDELMECVALNAMSFVDPKIAAAYVLSRERRNCGNLGAGIQPGVIFVAREEWLLKNRRDRCAFEKTQALLARLLEQGRAQQGFWLPYIVGQIHMARAIAVTGVDGFEQLSELDQAIGRFGELERMLPDSVSALAVLTEAHVRKGVLIHEESRALRWSDDLTSPLQWQLYLAESTFADAEAKLRRIPSQRSAALSGIVGRVEGYLIYRRWMLMAHRRTKLGVVTTAVGQSAELQLLGKAAALYAAAETNGVSAAAFYIEWGNILRAMGRFDEAAAQYSRAAERDPTDTTSRLNIAVNYLDRVIHGPEPCDPLNLLIGLGATADYLSWASSGGPYTSFTAQIAQALARSGHDGDRQAFLGCLTGATAAPDPGSRWRAAAEVKLCVDLSMAMINTRVRFGAAPAAPAASPR